MRVKLVSEFCIVNNKRMKIYKLLLLCLLHVMAFFPLKEQTAKRFTLSGHVKDAKTGEDLIGAAVIVKGKTSSVYSKSLIIKK